MKRHLIMILMFFIAFPLAAAEPVDLQMVGRIRNEGFRNSNVMEIARNLTDRLGPRLTGSPQLRNANEWTREKFAEWGLKNAHLEEWEPFGRSWSYDFATTFMTAPTFAQFYAIPKAWTPSTEGEVRGKAIRLKLETTEDLEKQKGKLAGRILLLGEPIELKVQEKAPLKRYDEQGLEDVSQYRIPPVRRPGGGEEYMKRRAFSRALAQFLMDEKVAAVFEPGKGGDGGTFDVGGTSWRIEDPVGVPTLVLAAEHFNRVSRLLDAGSEVELAVNVRTTMDDSALVQYNTIAEIPGTDPRGEIVMMGAHLDSWHGGTGATDNAAGVAAMMEAVRILKALDVKPKRTIRIALWTGEEQGLFGSRKYVEKHFAKWSDPKDPALKDLPRHYRPQDPGTLTILPGHGKLSAYFNMDNGTGKIRGIWTEENFVAAPIFEEWIRPLRDLGVTTVSMRQTGGTDHLAFDQVGLPGFQFIQDDVEYSGRTHHSNTDVYDRLQREDLMQASVVIATFVYNAAMREGRFPRKPLPKEAVTGNPARR